MKVSIVGGIEGTGDGTWEGAGEGEAGEGPDVHPAMNVREITMTMAYSTFLFIFYCLTPIEDMDAALEENL